MENKLTPKQALQVLNRNLFDLSINPYAYKNFEEKNESFDIVEQALTELEKQTQILKILKSKKVHFQIIKRCGTVQEYNQWVFLKEFAPLAEEEFNLLKEWLKQ